MLEARAPMRIAGLIFGSLRKMGGYQVFTYNLLKRLAARGHQVDLYLPQGEYARHRAFYLRMPFSVRPLFFRTKFVFKYVPGMVKGHLRYLQLRHRYDIWQIVGAYPAGYLADALSERVPLVLRTHGEDIQMDPALNYGMRLDPGVDRLIRKTLHRMDRVVALTESVTACYRELGVSEKHIVEIPNGIDLTRFSMETDRKATRRAWGLPEDMPVVLTVGRAHPKKGYDLIPKAARMMMDWGRRFVWLVVGKGADGLKVSIEREGVRDLVRTAEEVGVAEGSKQFDLPDARLVELYRCADVFAFPSLMETFGRVLVEAMAAGLPVVTTDVPGCRDVVKDGAGGILVRSGDVAAFAREIDRVMGDVALKNRLIESGRQRVQIYGWDEVVAQYEELYASLKSMQKAGDRCVSQMRSIWL